MKNIFKQHVVKFKDGTHGLRKWVLFNRFMFKDLSKEGKQYWWFTNSRYFYTCKTSKGKVLEYIKGAKIKIKQDKGTIV